jgi:hypothetical protein
MKFEEVVKYFGNYPWFDFEMVWLLSGESEECIHTELYRWREAGKILELRRGMFVLAEPWRHRTLEGSELADPLYSPSYLSGSWALAYYGIRNSSSDITVPVFTSVSPRPAKTFENVFGIFEYNTLPKDLLFGVRTIVLGEKRIKIALPEKAVLDFVFTTGGEWDLQRLETHGFNLGNLDMDRLEDFAEAAARPRLIRATRAITRRTRKRDPARDCSNENYLHKELREKFALIQASEPSDRWKIHIEKYLIALAMKVLHEAGAFASVCLTKRSANQLININTDSSIPLEFIRTSKVGYSPERWLFKMQRLFRYRGLETRIAFARKTNVHTGWIKLMGVFEPTSITFVFSEETCPSSSEIKSQCITASGESFAIRFCSSD